VSFLFLFFCNICIITQQPGFLIEHQDKKYLIECGPGITNQIKKAGFNPVEIDNVFLTHFHVDHIIEFPFFVKSTYLTGRSGPINVYGPTGMNEFMDNLMNKTCYYIPPLIRKLRDKEVVLNVKEFDKGVILEEDNLKVEALNVLHDESVLKIMKTNCYKFSVDGKSIVISGDFEACKALTDMSKDVDILIAECSMPEEVGYKPGHCLPSALGKLAQDAKVKKVVVMHLFPPHRGKEQEAIDIIKEYFTGEVVIANDFDVFEVY